MREGDLTDLTLAGFVAGVLRLALLYPILFGYVEIRRRPSGDRSARFSNAGPLAAAGTDG